MTTNETEFCRETFATGRWTGWRCGNAFPCVYHHQGWPAILRAKGLEDYRTMEPGPKRTEMKTRTFRAFYGGDD